MLQDVYPVFLQKIIYPLFQSRRPPDERWLKHLQILEKTQWWTPQELEELQQKSLRLLIKHAYNNVPYYHRIFRKRNLKPDDIKNTEDLLKLPRLTKEDIRNNLDDLVAINYKQDVMPGYSGGTTTGEPLKFYSDKRSSAWRWAALHRDYRWCGYDLGDKLVVLWGHFGDLKEHTTLQKFDDILKRRRLLSCFDMTNESMAEYIEFLRRFKPKIIKGYSSALYLLAEFMRHNKIEGVEPEAIITTADNLFKYQREIIKSQFCCEVFDDYGNRETSLRAFECKEHSGYHISIENGVLELIMDNEHVEDGEIGAFLITDFNNYTMPFIRYEIGDAGTLTNEICSCGRGLPMIRSIEGRIVDILTTPSGRYLPGEFLIAIFAYYEIEGVKNYQVIQKRKDKLLFKLVKTSNFMDEKLEIMINIIQQYTGDEMEIEIVFVDSIPPSKSGKRRFTISEVPIKF